MTRRPTSMAEVWSQIGPRMLPFADAGTTDLPLGRLLRLGLFQLSVGMAVVLVTGTLNRVMILELGVPAWLVAAMVALPLVFAPFRALIGFRSDIYQSVLGWRRVPFIWFGSLLQFGGLAIMPFALLVLSGEGHGPAWIGMAGAALAFLLTGAGLHTTQTTGLALATDLAPESTRPRVVALLYVMLLLGMVVSAIGFGLLLAEYSHGRLIRVVQGAAVVTMLLNAIALWKQEPRDPERTRFDEERPGFREAWRAFAAHRGIKRFLVAVGLGTAAFSMQDILLEPYGGEVLGLSVAATTRLTAWFAGGTLVAFGLAARRLARGSDPHRLAAGGVLIGIVGFSAVIFAAPLDSGFVFRAGVVMIGFGGGLFAVTTLIAAMGMSEGGHSGLALGAWGAVQATAFGGGLALGGVIRDVINGLAAEGMLGPALQGPSTGYGFVYHLEILLLFATLAAIGPLVRATHRGQSTSYQSFGLARFPG